MKRVFKFGGASVKDADAVKNIHALLLAQPQLPAVIVVSAMGKTTNHLENVISAYFKKEDYLSLLSGIEEAHFEICNGLAITHDSVKELFIKLRKFLKANTSSHYNFVYDQVVSYGELVSTKIISDYLNRSGLHNAWADARELICTDNTYTDAKVDFNGSEHRISSLVAGTNTPVVTQGFIGASPEGFTTTLGREGSDYTGAIIAYALRADAFCIWKDVQGVFNADPKVFNDARILPALSYKEVIEMTFYGAKVIHPKTIKPLQNRNIPLHVRSFIDFKKEGTVISADEPADGYPPVIVQKKNQVLISFSVRDFSFVAKDSIVKILAVFDKYSLGINLMQNTAINFSTCVDAKADKIERVITDLNAAFLIKQNDDLELLTIRHYKNFDASKCIGKSEMLLEQLTRNTRQILLRNSAQ